MKVLFNKHKFHRSHTLVLIDSIALGAREAVLAATRRMTETRMIRIQTTAMMIKTMKIPSMNTLVVPYI
jgi:hypothetical protein